MTNLEILKKEQIDMLQGNCDKGILEKSNVDLLTKLINNAENETEVFAIAQLGTSYKKTGLHYDKKLEKTGDEVKYFVKNKDLSFVTDENAITHKLIIGDNYDALLNLLITHRGKIDVIYIDPPYGKDSMGAFADTNYDNAITRDNLLSMLYPRLTLAKLLLSDEGVIFVSIDDRNQAYVKCLMDEVFGERFFAAAFPWRKRTAKSDVPFGVSQDHEWVLCYAKSEQTLLSIDGKGRKYYETPDFPNRPWRIHDMTTQRTATERPNSFFTMVNPKTGEEYPCDPNRTWRVTKDTFQQYYNANEIVFPGDYDFLKIAKPVARYFKDNDMIKDGENFGKVAVSTNLPDDIGMSQDGTKEIKSIFNDLLFSFPKSSKFIKFFVKVAGKQDAIVLDFFAGSGTTGQAVLALNKEDGGHRQFILCTNNEEADGFIATNVTSKRLKRVMTGKCYDGTSDFKWAEENEPYGDNLEVLEIAKVKNNDRKIFEKIDEKLYGQKFEDIKDKIDWVCANFAKTQKCLEDE